MMSGRVSPAEVVDRDGPALFPSFEAMLRANRIPIPARNRWQPSRVIPNDMPARPLVHAKPTGKISEETPRRLTSREKTVLWLVAQGLSNRQIAIRIHRSEHTVKLHVHNACTKMGTHSRTRAAVEFVLSQGEEALSRIEPSAPGTLFAVYRAQRIV